jgi:opacity protein-like surface antigen
MHKRLQRFQVACLAVLSFVPSVVLAQSEEEFHHFTLSAGAGLTTITGADAGKLDHGGNLQLDGGYFLNRYLGITGNFMFSDLGITRTELNSLNVPDGSARMYSVTADPTLRVPLGRGFSAYVLAGGGYLRRTVEFTRPTLAQTVIFNPWWGYLGPVLVPANQILGTVTNNSGGFDVGGGLNIPLHNTGAKLFVEARYFKGFTSNTNTTVIPITFGIRW